MLVDEGEHDQGEHEAGEMAAEVRNRVDNDTQDMDLTADGCIYSLEEQRLEA